MPFTSNVELAERQRSRRPPKLAVWLPRQRLKAMAEVNPSVKSFDAAPLIVAVARQDRAAFAALFEHFAPRIKSMLMGKGVPDQRAEDLAQETMLTVWRKAHLFDPEGSNAAAWIFTIARNRNIDLARQQRHEVPEAAPSEEILPDDQPLADAQIVAGQEAARLHAALSGLSQEQLAVVRLSFFEERPHNEIAQALQIPLGTVKSRLRLAMGRLRTLLDDTP